MMYLLPSLVLTILLYKNEAGIPIFPGNGARISTGPSRIISFSPYPPLTGSKIKKVNN